MFIKAQYCSSFLLHRYGRKKTIFPCWSGLIVTVFCTSFVNDYWIFVALRFVTGLFQGASFLVIPILSSELVGPKHNGTVMTIILICQSVASALLGIQAWLIPNWKHLLQITSMPYVIGLIGYW